MEQITKTDSNATDAGPIMVRSARIIREENKALSETTKSEVQPKGSPQNTSEETTLAREPAPRLPVVEDRDSPNLSTSGEPMQSETDKNPEDR
jgi:hypothetical protein